MRDPARVARDRLLRQERQARARAEAEAVARGVTETVALSRARGAAIAQGAAGPRAKPYRRLSGLDWLASRGKIDAAAKAAGERYGAAYRRARLEASIASTLEVQPGAGRGFTPDLTATLAHGEGTAAAGRRLAQMRARLARQPDLVAACDLVCGEELTPREAAAGDRDATRLEAVLKVALDILAG
jgi:hypothetical protein